MSDFREVKPAKIEITKPEVQKEPLYQYPTLRLDLEHIPEAKNWENGQDYEVSLLVRQTKIVKTIDDILPEKKDIPDNQKEKGYVEFDILAIKTDDRKPERDNEMSESSYRERYTKQVFEAKKEEKKDKEEEIEGSYRER